MNQNKDQNKDQNKNLLPCPFCGANAHIEKTSMGLFYPRCSGRWIKDFGYCIASRIINPKTDGFATKQQATDKWNLRTEKNA